MTEGEVDDRGQVLTDTTARAAWGARQWFSQKDPLPRAVTATQLGSWPGSRAEPQALPRPPWGGPHWARLRLTPPVASGSWWLFCLDLQSYGSS